MPCGENRMASIFLWGFPYPIFSGLKMDAKKSKGRIPICHKRRVKSYLKFTFLQRDIIKNCLTTMVFSESTSATKLSTT